MEKVGFVFLPSYLEAIRALPDRERLAVYDALCAYGVEGIETETDSGIVQAMLLLMKPNVDQSRRRYQSCKENGSKGGRPRKNQSETKPEPAESKEKDMEMEKEMDMDKEEERETDKDRESAGVCASPSGSPMGNFQNVFLSSKELTKLQTLRPFDWYNWIEDLSAYMASTGRRYENHYATILSWIQRKAGPEEEPAWDDQGRTGLWSVRPEERGYSIIPN